MIFSSLFDFMAAKSSIENIHNIFITHTYYKTLRELNVIKFMMLQE